MTELSKLQRLARLGFVPQKAVRWFAPRELVSAGLRVGLSGAFGEYSDKRELETLFEPSLHEELPHAGDEVWIDYVADLGDGFDATYTVAKAVSAPKLEVSGCEPLLRGSILVMGGDEVYPTAGRAEYRNRTVGPYKTALPHTDAPHPRIFALPGNHDWYDGLTSFIRVFCDRQWLGGWQLPQTRSYFAVRVAPRWWVWGIDIQFEGYIDTPQCEFFADVAGPKIAEGDGLILCSAKPAWARAGDGEDRPSASMRNLDYFVRRCVPDQARIRLNLAGDWHHYGRYTARSTGAQYVTSGGGGAYLSGTHHLEPTITVRAAKPEDDTELELVSTYPDTNYSRSRRFTGPLIGWRNPSFGALLGVVYLLMAALAVATESGEATFAKQLELWSNNGVKDTWWPVVKALFAGGVGIGAVIVLSSGFISLTQPARVGRLRGIAVGLAHLVAHLAAIAAGVALTTAGLSMYDSTTSSTGWWSTWVVLMVVFGAFVGPVVVGVYFGLADLVGINSNELFAGQRIKHRKHFLRMRITDDDLTVHVVGLDRTPRWRPDFEAAPERVVFKPKTSDDEASEPRLIERFTITREPTS